MEFEFTTHLGQTHAKFSMGHEAIGQWFNDELGAHLEKIDALLIDISALENKQKQKIERIGYDLILELSRTQVCFSPLNDDNSLAGLEEDSDAEIYDQESQAECSLLDFKSALQSWREFVSR